MLEIINQIQKHSEKLPTDACTSTNNPTPLHKIIFQLTRGLELCRISIGYYTKHKIDSPPWIDHKTGKEWHPWKKYKAEHWMDLRERLLSILCCYYDKFSLTYDDLTNKKKYVASEMVMLVSAHIMICAFLSMSPEEKNELTSTSAQTIPFIDDMHLAPHNGPVLSYSMKQYSESLFAFTSRINEIIYHEDIRKYLMLLDLRAALFLLYPENGIVHDITIYRTIFSDEGNGTLLYIASPRFLSNITAIMNSVRNKIGLGKIFPRIEPEESPDLCAPDPELMQAAICWLVKRASFMTSKASSEWIEDVYVKMNLWPAEMEIFKQDFPNDICTPLSVLKKYRDAHFVKILQNGELPVCDIITKQLENRRTSGERFLEPLNLQLALIELCALHFRNIYSSFDFTEFVVIDLDLDMQFEGLRREDRPRLVQAFNHFQLFYQQKLYVHNSFISSLCSWFKIMYANFDGRVSKRMKLDKFAKEIFGPELFQKKLEPFKHISERIEQLSSSTPQVHNEPKRKSLHDPSERKSQKRLKTNK